jgi:hypothetical protein
LFDSVPVDLAASCRGNGAILNGERGESPELSAPTAGMSTVLYVMTFLEWNDTIAGHFFREEKSGRTVYLYVTQKLIEELGSASGATPADFIAAMKAGPSWATRTGLCQKAIQSMEGWQARHLQWPPYIGYLALFVLAAGLEGDFASHSYYPRLRALLGEPPVPGQQYPSFQRMYELWSDLEQWAGRKKQGALGVLRLDIAGSWMHVGLPVAQTILTEAERQHLHQRVFAEGGLDSGDPLPDAELARIIRENGVGQLRPRTLAALAPDKVQSEYSLVLLDRILEELEGWTAADTLERPAGPSPLRGRLLLGLQIDSTARLATVRFHVRLRQDEAGTVAVTHDGLEYTCRLLPDGHSTALLDASGKHLDGAQFDWLRPITLAAHDKLLLHAPASQVRIFTDGSLAGMSGFIETHLLDPTRSFAVAVAGQAVEHVRAWGEVSCLDFRERQLLGLPAGWVLFTAIRATSDALIREHVPQLSFAHHLRRIRLEGGLRLPGATQYYFRFAPPVIRLEGASEDAGVLLNGLITVARNPAGTFNIPDDLLVEDTISVACAGTSLRRFVYLRDQLDASGAYWQRTYTPAGVLEEATLVTVTHIACGIPASHESPSPPSTPLLPLEPRQTAVLVGAQPGQVAAYQPGVLPAWEPVWAVVRHRKVAVARFIGRSLSPPDLSLRGSQRSVRAWRSVLWHQRKRISPPAFEPARALWLAYQEAAHNA